MHQESSAISPRPARDAARFASSRTSVLDWDGRSPIALIGAVEARLAAGAPFVVLAPSTPLGRAADRGLLEGWWRVALPRLAGLCVGWAALVPEAAIPAEPTTDGAFPIRFCADRAEALWWLRSRLAGSPSPAHAA